MSKLTPTGEIILSYGFIGSDGPIIRTSVRWSVDRTHPTTLNAEGKTWLCVPKEEGQ